MGDQPEALVKFASILASSDGERDLSERLCESVRVVLDAHGAAISIELRGRARALLCATDAVTETFERLQLLVGGGPAHAAVTEGRMVEAKIGAPTFGRWPDLEAAARRSGLGGTFWAVPLRPGDVAIGVLTLHRQDGSLREDSSTTQFIADALGKALIRDPELLAPGEQIRGPWKERALIHQATGVVAAQLRIGVEDAFEILRAHGYAHELELLAVARGVIDRRIDLSGV